MVAALFCPHGFEPDCTVSAQDGTGSEPCQCEGGCRILWPRQSVVASLLPGKPLGKLSSALKWEQLSPIAKTVQAWRIVECLVITAPIPQDLAQVSSATRMAPQHPLGPLCFLGTSTPHSSQRATGNVLVGRRKGRVARSREMAQLGDSSVSTLHHSLSSWPGTGAEPRTTCARASHTCRAHRSPCSARL